MGGTRDYWKLLDITGEYWGILETTGNNWRYWRLLDIKEITADRERWPSVAEVLIEY